MTAVLALTGGSVTAASRDGGEREVAAADFFLGPLESSLRPGELAVSARFPRFPAGTHTAFVEVARRHGDYAMCGVGVAVAVEGGTVSSATRGLHLDVADAARRRPDRARWPAVRSTRPTGLRPATWCATVVDPEADIHATAHYRRHLAGVLTGRALAEATGSATGQAA